MAGIDWTDENNTDPQGAFGQAADNTSGFGGGSCNNSVDWGKAHPLSLGHAVTNLHPCDGGGSGYRLLFESDPEYGYVAFTSVITQVGDGDIVTFKMDSFQDGFFLLGRASANRTIELNATSIDIRIGATTHNMPTTGSNLDETVLKRVGSVITAYRTADLGTAVGSVDTGSTLNLIWEYIGRNGATVSTAFFKEGALRTININNQTSYNADQGSGNLNDLIGSNTGILSTAGTSIPIYQAV